MALKTFKPYTKSTRGTILVDRTGLWKGKPFKALVEPKNSMRGRNNNGHITSRNMSGGGHKKMYRLVDFYRKKLDMPGTVERIEYDPNRSCYIMLVKFDDGQHFYYLAPQKINIGDKVENGSEKEIKVGNCMPLRDIPVGINIHNVELNPGGGGKIARSAGTSVTISGLDGNYSLVKMISGEVRKIDSRCMATIGVLSNPDQKNIKIGKAGRSRWLGRRPHTRGVVMNPVDHPHGGGEGKTAGGRHPVSPTGQSAKGFKTRNNKSTDKFIVKKRNNRKDSKK
ncbi:MAG: 50S ribosomal protein L2 [Pelagibacteraceae bacterium BACL20 MAG-120920-bin64]|jgi:large subunit ribosomal protein L2|nr:MAG: 50S ribosomal protein L2 [Pelagibacteraceae bacterium BACL20 MAG-120920-bin64]KRP04361.1 MAG: 50S ribosomal protein L2 [Pelagibacteraceae bacterium BACL20 MAG-120920-bin64]